MKIEKIKKCIAIMEKLNKKFKIDFDEDIEDLKELVKVMEELSVSEH